MIRAVFFDLDDTLVDAMECHLLANEKAFADFGISYAEVEEKTKDFDFLGKRMKEILLEMRNAVGVSEDKLPLKKLQNVREKYFLKYVLEFSQLLSGSRKALQIARNNCEIVGVVSSGTRKYIEVALKKFKLKEFVDFTVGEEDVRRGKPYPDSYEVAFQKLPKKYGITKNDCLVVEDSANGVKAAKAAGIRVVLIPSRFTKGEINADWKLKSLEEFNLELFNKHLRKIEKLSIDLHQSSDELKSGKGRRLKSLRDLR